MILPFTTNQWNAIRFVVINLISVPLIELALHRLHQLGVADRMLQGRKVRVRPSFLANWGLHQEVDELSVRSRITAFVVAFFYVGFSLYTEYASGSVPKKSVWEPPVLPLSLLQDKPALFDTTLMPAGSFPGCRSKKSREKLQQLLQHTLKVRVRRHIKFTKPMTKYHSGHPVSFRIFVGDTFRGPYGEIRMPFNSIICQHCVAVFLYKKRRVPFVAAMHDEEICFRSEPFFRYACFSKSENTTFHMLLGNTLLYDGFLGDFGAGRGYLMLSAAAFNFRCWPIERIGKSNCDAFALARTATEFSNVLSKVSRSYKGNIYFQLKFNYGFGLTDDTCNETPKIEPSSVSVPEKAKLSLGHTEFYKNPFQYSPSKKVSLGMQQLQSSIWFGPFNRKLIYVQDLKDSRRHCSSDTGHLRKYQFCAQRHFNGTSLSRVGMTRFNNWNLKGNSITTNVSISIEWTLNWMGQDLKLSDLSRGAVAYSIAAKEYLDIQSLSAHSISDALKRGIPKLTRVGYPGVRYDEIAGDDERATVYALVLGVWAVMLLIAVIYLLFVKLSKARLFPDIYLLYCHSVMRKHTRYNNGKSIRSAPTAAMASTKGIVNLSISYDELSAGDITVNDMLQ